MARLPERTRRVSITRYERNNIERFERAEGLMFRGMALTESGRESSDDEEDYGSDLDVADAYDSEEDCSFEEDATFVR